MSGPLSGLKVIEMPAIGPVPFCGMLLADLGADVLRIDRTGDADLGLPVETKYELAGRGKRSLALDLKDPKAIELMLQLVEKADVILEGFRPGVMERLGLGPDVACQRNPKLVYGRMTGWGQDGPLSHAAGHDINYIALTGALHAIGHKDGKPVPPLNLVGDFGGGSLYLAMGVLAALFERQQSGRGQVVDAAMVDGAASLMTMFYGMKAAGIWTDQHGVNILDSGAPWYDTYECKDGKFVSIGSIEGKFYAELIKVLGLDPVTLPKQHDRKNWESLRAAFAAVFKTRTRDEWCALMEGSDICFAPVLSLEEAPGHPHMAARRNFVERDGVVQPAPAPRFSRTPGAIRSKPAARGEGGEDALRDWGVMNKGAMRAASGE
ncbi:CaiB/BaiF CoA-transferase family protein [uncultured Ferrovibrio sp.]|jgi:alpha-methylacyl-CoA racemase|uniref:CaiB/BaiF CoA transferase family protein n=1 Tax=uncultured Ferrovibrio sp. TaxID=1576913 RepID=UPI00263441D3|nr:CaiB/BaiF CoA-transferase family protein [uncultured Ferrovibrio sp.]